MPTLLAGFASEAARSSLANKFAWVKASSANALWKSRKIVLDNLLHDYIRISSTLGEAPARSVLVLPLVFEGQVKGVLELAAV